MPDYADCLLVAHQDTSESFLISIGARWLLEYLLLSSPCDILELAWIIGNQFLLWNAAKRYPDLYTCFCRTSSRYRLPSPALGFSMVLWRGKKHFTDGRLGICLEIEWSLLHLSALLFDAIYWCFTKYDLTNECGTAVVHIMVSVLSDLNAKVFARTRFDIIITSAGTPITARCVA
jgi:hypothetical protein